MSDVDEESLNCPPDADCRTTCCCGGEMEGHGFYDGHSPVSMHDWYCTGVAEER